jgi:hypothetical protein
MTSDKSVSANFGLFGCSISASPTVITAGGSSTLTYTTNNATSASINNGVGSVTPGSNLTRSVTPGATTSYSMTVVNGSKTATCGPATVSIGCTPTTETRTTPCPVPQTGDITEQRSLTCPAGTWSNWTETGNTCVTPCDISDILVTSGSTFTRSGNTYTFGTNGEPVTINFNGTVTPETSGPPAWTAALASTTLGQGTTDFTAIYDNPGTYAVSLSGSAGSCIAKSVIIEIVDEGPVCTFPTPENEVKLSINGEPAGEIKVNEKQPVTIEATAEPMNTESGFMAKFSLLKKNGASYVELETSDYQLELKEHSFEIKEIGDYRVNYMVQKLSGSGIVDPTGLCNDNYDFPVLARPYCAVSPQSGTVPLRLRGEAELPDGTGDYVFTITKRESDGTNTEVAVITVPANGVTRFIKSIDTAGQYDVTVSRGAVTGVQCNLDAIVATNSGDGDGGEVTPGGN